jgi:hypothetical protein
MWRGFRPGQNQVRFRASSRFLILAVMSVFLTLTPPVWAQTPGITNLEVTINTLIQQEKDHVDALKKIFETEKSRQTEFLMSFPWKFAIGFLAGAWILNSCVGAFFRYKESRDKKLLETLTTLTKGAIPDEKWSIDKLRVVITNFDKLQKTVEIEAIRPKPPTAGASTNLSTPGA